jgi:hypothetical protein
MSGTEPAWTVVWQHPHSSFDRDIYGKQIRWDGWVLTPIFPIETSVWDETNPVVSTILDSTTLGGPRPCLVAYERDFGDHDIGAALIDGSTVIHRTNLSGKLPSDLWFHDQTAPVLDSDGRMFLLGFNDRDTSNNEYNAILSDYFWDGSTLAACTPYWSIAAFPGFAEFDLAVHARAASGGPKVEYATAWTTSSTHDGYEIKASYYDTCSNLVETVCNADGSGSVQCPCGNNGDFNHGCANSDNSHGGLITFYGSSSVSYDAQHTSASLRAFLMPPNVPCLFFQGTSLMSGTPFGNGLRCVTGTTIRIGLKPCNGNGAAEYPWQGDMPLSLAGQVPSAGDTRYYQAWYRDPASTCGSTFNLTNALRVIWVP